MNPTVYFVASHKNPAQVYRLASTLRKGSPDCHIVIHHDPKGEPLDPVQLRAINAHSIKPALAVEWGDITHVDMILHSLRWIQQSLDYDWLVFISGQDYPVKPIRLIERELHDSRYDGFLRGFPVLEPNSWPAREGHLRYYYRYFKLPRLPYYYRLPAPIKALLTDLRKTLCAAQPLLTIRLGPRVKTRIGFRRLATPFSASFKCYGGPEWFSLNRLAVKYVIEYVDRQRRLYDFYKPTYIPDESFFNTILLNNTALSFSQNNKRYVHWAKDVKYGGSSPQIIRTEDIEALRHTDAHFARKFDTGIDSEVLDLIDRELLNRSV